MPYTPIPYERKEYRSPYEGTIGELLGRRGQREAELIRQRGDIQAQMWANAGNAISGAVQGYQQQRELDRRRAIEEEDRATARAANARAARLDEIRLGEAEAQAAEAKRNRDMDARERSLRPLLFQQDEDGNYLFDEAQIAREYEVAGMGDRLPAVTETIGRLNTLQQQRSNLEKEGRAELLIGFARNGYDPSVLPVLREFASKNRYMPPQEIDALVEQLAGPNAEQVTQALLGTLEGTSAVKEFRKLTEPKFGIAAPGATVFNERNGEVQFTAPEKAPTLGSFEDYVARTFGPNPTPAQIVQARKDYQQADDRPQVNLNLPRPLTENAESALISRFSTEWQKANAPAKELQRQIAIMDEGLKAADRGDMAQASEAVLNTFLKILDPTSVVREGEFWRLQQGQSLLSRAQAAVQRFNKGGWATRAELDKYATLARDIAAASERSTVGTRSRLERNLQRYNIPPELIFDDASAPAGGGENQGGGDGEFKVGDIVMFNGKRHRVVGINANGSAQVEPVK